MATHRDPRKPDDGTVASRLGLFLFWIYVALYGGFMALVLVRRDLLSLRRIARSMAPPHGSSG